MQEVGNAHLYYEDNAYFSKFFTCKYEDMNEKGIENF